MRGVTQFVLHVADRFDAKRDTVYARDGRVRATHDAHSPRTWGPSLTLH